MLTKLKQEKQHEVGRGFLLPQNVVPEKNLNKIGVQILTEEEFWQVATVDLVTTTVIFFWHIPVNSPSLNVTCLCAIYFYSDPCVPLAV